MRKVISALLGVIFIAMFFALAVTAQSSETDAAIKAAYGTPIIDGEPDDIWLATEVQEILKVDKEVIPPDT